MTPDPTAISVATSTPGPATASAASVVPAPGGAGSPFTDARPRCVAVLPAAGTGSRMGADRPKQFLALARDGRERTLLEHAVAAFLAAPSVSAVAVVVSPGDDVASQLPGLRDDRVSLLPAGGATRRDSVLGGLQALAAAGRLADDDWVLVHDAARCGLEAADIEALLAALAGDPVGGLLALPVVDTVKRADAEGRVAATEPRDGLWLAQTPQVFRAGVLRAALEAHPDVTDEAGAIERSGLRPRLVPGTRANLKVTHPEDLAWLAAWWQRAGT